MTRGFALIALGGLVLVLALPTAAEAQAVGVRCKSVQAGGYRATHVFADFMPCRSVRAKLRRWLPRGRLTQNSDGWYCYRLHGVVRACTYPGRRGIGGPKSFTFRLRRVARTQAAAPLTCRGYAEERQFVEAQSWWADVSGTPVSHAHVGACVPEWETLRGTSIPIDVRMVMHDNPGEFSTLRITVKGDGYEKNVFEHDYEEDCLQMTCVKWQHFDVPLSAFDYSGLQEMRLRFTTEEANGKTQKPSLGWKVHVENGKSRKHFPRNPWMRGKGWYSDNGYCTADQTTALPDEPVSGTFTASLRFRHHGSSDDNPVTAHEIRMNPNIHMGDGGTLLKADAGEFGGPFPIHTTRFSDGANRLFMKSDCPADDGSLLSGILIYPITVANGTTPPLRPPAQCADGRDKTVMVAPIWPTSAVPMRRTTTSRIRFGGCPS
jgi:hypothetical protein